MGLLVAISFLLRTSLRLTPAAKVHAAPHLLGDKHEGEWRDVVLWWFLLVLLLFGDVVLWPLLQVAHNL